MNRRGLQMRGRASTAQTRDFMGSDQSRGRGLKEVITHIRFRLSLVVACSEAQTECRCLNASSTAVQAGSLSRRDGESSDFS
jgi:hypothetical protein